MWYWWVILMAGIALTWWAVNGCPFPSTKEQRMTNWGTTSYLRHYWQVIREFLFQQREWDVCSECGPGADHPTSCHPIKDGEQ